MKKLLAVIASLAVLTGCSNAYTTVSKVEPIFTVGDKSVTSKDLYSTMKLSDSARTVILDAQTKITEEVKDEDVQDQIDARLAELKAVFGDQLEPQIIASGYTSVDDFMKQNVIPTIKMDYLIKDLIEEDFANLAKEYQPRKARILQVSDEQTAISARQRIVDGESFDTVAQQVAMQGSQYNGAETIYMVKGVEYPSAVSNELKNATGPKLSEVLSDTNQSGAKYIVEIVDVDSNNFKEDAITAFQANRTLTNDYVAKLFVKNGFKVYDKDVYDAVSKQLPQYLGLKEVPKQQQQQQQKAQ